MQAVAAHETAEHIQAMAAALVRELEMEPTDAREIASYVLAAFEGREELDDEELSSDLRSIFYTLEGKRLLSFRREEYRNEEGQLRRAFFWHIRWEEVGGLDEGTAEESQGRDMTVYEELPRSAWSRA